jgi:PAS domain S-box-containing protein
MWRKEWTLRYGAAIVWPALLGALWPFFPRLVKESPGYTCAIAVGLVARYLGFGPAVASTAVGILVLFHRAFVLQLPHLTSAEIAVKIALFVGTAVVIASIARQRTEDLREAEEHYRTLVELSPDGISVSREGRMIFANGALARMLGARSPEELAGRHYRDVIRVDSMALVEERIRRVEAGESVSWAEEKWLRLDGTTIEVETSAIPLHKDGALLVQLFTRDLTVRKEAEKTIEESHRRLQAMFDASIDAIIFLDASGHYIDANPAALALYGYSKDEFLRMRIGDLTPTERRDEIQKVWSRVAAGEDVGGPFVMRTKDGNRRTIEFRIKSNVLPGLHYSVMHDVTAQKQAEESLRRLSLRLLRSRDEERRRIARQLHETTAQTLAALRMNLARLNESASDDHRELVRDSIELSDQAIKEIRTLSYLLHPPLMDEMGLLPALKWYVSGFEQRSGIAVTLDVAGLAERLPAEIENVVFRIVQETLSNIHRHSGSAVASIRLERQDDSLVVEIADRGHGLPAEMRHKPLGDAAMLGVGIAGMHERVRELNGEMALHSDDHGTAVTVKLPVR